MSTRAPARQWSYIAAIVLLALVLAGMIHAFVVMVANHTECAVHLANRPPDAPAFQQCMQQQLATPAKWLNTWLVVTLGTVGVFTAWKLWTGHWIVVADRQNAFIGTRASLRYAYSSTIYWLLGLQGVALIFLILIYTDGMRA